MRKGEIIVISGTNEVVICMDKGGGGIFSERFKNNQLGQLSVIGKLNPKQARLYWETQKGDKNVKMDKSFR